MPLEQKRKHQAFCALAALENNAGAIDEAVAHLERAAGYAGEPEERTRLAVLAEQMALAAKLARQLSETP